MPGLEFWQVYVANPPCIFCRYSDSMPQAVGQSTGISVNDLLNRQGTPAARNNAALPASGQAFSSLVSQIMQRKPVARGNTFEDLMADLDDQEREFAENPSRDRFEEYKKTVKALCSMLLQRGYRLQGWEDRRKKRYEVVRTIDARLAQLYSGLLRRNQDVVIALHLMGQIRGLIFDLQA